MSPSSIKFVDLFAGIGGMRLPLESRGYECVFTSEIDNFARGVYADNFAENEADIFGDISRLEEGGIDLIPDHDFLLAGFPCQPFSGAGKKRGFADETRGTLFFSIAQIAKAKAPRFILLENVKGLISHDSGRTMAVILDTLRSAGYLVFTEVLNARDFGLPQNRQRLFIVAIRNTVPLASDFTFPMPTSNRDELRVGDFLDKPLDGLYISDKIWSSHQARKIRNREEGKGFGFQMVTRESRYTATISARYYKDGSEILIDEQDGRNPRKLSAREAIRIQGFPETFRTDSSYSQATKQAGNAVPVPVVDAIVGQLVRYF